jgi:hypothetical protein
VRARVQVPNLRQRPEPAVGGDGRRPLCVVERCLAASVLISGVSTGSRG